LHSYISLLDRSIFIEKKIATDLRFSFYFFTDFSDPFFVRPRLSIVLMFSYNREGKGKLVPSDSPHFPEMSVFMKFILDPDLEFSCVGFNHPRKLTYLYKKREIIVIYRWLHSMLK